MNWYLGLLIIYVMQKISQKIIDYSIWYYLRYYPSPKKLAFKLKMKFGPESEKGKKYNWISDEEIEYILTNKLKNIIQEEEVIQSKIRNYKNKWKSKLYIKQKLFERQENKDLIEKYLEEMFLDWEIENIKKELNKLWYSNNLEYHKREKILKKLFNKGFKYDEIQRLI